ncbi:MAG: hypothetical protein Q8N47_03300 [Bryobacterales bacterium]|nr:hypothetical protein [Bryobacterales bacterium]
MARLLLAGAIALAAWGADCRTPLGIPCSTIRFETTQWQFTREGGLDLSHYTGVTISAVRSDGSFVEIADRQEMSRWFKREAGTAGSASMYLAPDDVVVRVDHQRKSISRRAPLLWNDRPYRYSTPGDRTCLSGIRRWGAHFFLRGTDTVAGVPVIRWSGANPGGGYTEVCLAPSLDCRPLKTHTVHRRFGILPTSISTTKAISVEWGEPKPELFALPAGYRESKE